jgi:hypothetical protein
VSCIINSSNRRRILVRGGLNGTNGINVDWYGVGINDDDAMNESEGRMNGANVSERCDEECFSTTNHIIIGGGGGDSR